RTFLGLGPTRVAPSGDEGAWDEGAPEPPPEAPSPPPEPPFPAVPGSFAGCADGAEAWGTGALSTFEVSSTFAVSSGAGRRTPRPSWEGASIVRGTPAPPPGFSGAPGDGYAGGLDSFLSRGDGACSGSISIGEDFPCVEGPCPLPPEAVLATPEAGPSVSEAGPSTARLSFSAPATRPEDTCAADKTPTVASCVGSEGCFVSSEAASRPATSPLPADADGFCLSRPSFCAGRGGPSSLPSAAAPPDGAGGGEGRRRTPRSRPSSSDPKDANDAARFCLSRPSSPTCRGSAPSDTARRGGGRGGGEVTVCEGGGEALLGWGVYPAEAMSARVTEGFGRAGREPPGGDL
ncbi:hypothetical protein T484DRAFT_1937245, partial [Baffinella frigidus]